MFVLAEYCFSSLLLLALLPFSYSSMLCCCRLLGKGSYGAVSLATDRVSETKVAIKQMKNIFDEQTDAKRAYREMHILRHLRHPNIISLLDVISPTIQRRICASGLVSSGCGTKSGDELDITQVWRALAAPEGSVFSMSGSGGSDDGNKTDMSLITPASMRKLQLGHLYL